ncbi:hypothetical protein OEA41_010697 [Lepraria neglecta]|uniref:FAD-binding domain-containing protein n=1 Tax=Lepraria neglecta TaxID=209136 RepID=A0AAD9YX30_9LECA|nr:hypothetical protein OEA41_010697 [Lepraria neglecta]
MAQPSKEIHSFSKGSPTPVLIVGAGPAGFMAGATLSLYGIPLRIIDKRPSPIQRGHASGLQPRTAEIFHSLGLPHELARYSNKMTETSFWFRENGELKRSKHSPEKDIFNPTNYPHVNIMHQGHTERIFVEDLSSRGVEVERPVEFVGFETSEHEEFPLNVRLKNLVSAMVEEVPVKHVLGCDGGRSTVRKSLKIESSVHQTSDSWAVAEVFAATNFLDARRRKYEGKGSELTNDKTVIGILTDRAKSLLHPFKIEIKEVESVRMYHIAQRIADCFCDVDDRVFILGDACHAHSPKAGRGMNVRMNDAYDLTWKLALTLRGRAKPSLLQTYQTERQYTTR